MQHIVVRGSHAVAVLCGRDRHLVDERDRAGPVLLEGIDYLNNHWGFALASDPVFVLLGVHSTPFDYT